MERTEKFGFGIASAAHVLLFAALSTSWISANPLKLRNDAVEVTFADEVALQSAARKLAKEPPPPAPGEAEGLPERAPPTPAEAVAPPKPAPAPEPAPLPMPQPRTVSKPAPRPSARSNPAPAKARPDTKEQSKPAKPQQSEKSRGMLKLDTSQWARSDSRADANSKATDGTLASSLSSAQKSALDAEIRRQIKPYWKAPTGADVELLRTVVEVDLSRDGSIVGEPRIVATTGQNASNRAQVRLHQEQAVKAIRLAAPFKLPAALYSAWQSLQIGFDKRLSQ